MSGAVGCCEEEPHTTTKPHGELSERVHQLERECAELRSSMNLLLSRVRQLERMDEEDEEEEESKGTTKKKKNKKRGRNQRCHGKREDDNGSAGLTRRKQIIVYFMTCLGLFLIYSFSLSSIFS